MIFSEPVWGWLSDRLGLRGPFLASRLGLAAGLWLLLLWPGLLPVMIWQAFSGAFAPTAGVLGRGYLVRAYVPSRQMTGLVLHLVVTSVAVALGSTAGSRLFDCAGSQAVFVSVAVLGTAGVVAALLLAEPPPFPAPEREMASPPAEVPLLSEGALILGGVAIVQYIAAQLMRTFMVLLIHERAELDVSAGGLLFGIYSLANV